MQSYLCHHVGAQGRPLIHLGCKDDQARGIPQKLKPARRGGRGQEGNRRVFQQRDSICDGPEVARAVPITQRRSGWLQGKGRSWMGLGSGYGALEGQGHEGPLSTRVRAMTLY